MSNRHLLWSAEQMELARETSKREQDFATRKFPIHSDEWFAELRIRELQREGVNFPACYVFAHNGQPDWYAWGCDFWTGFSWDKRAIVQANRILQDPRFPAIQQIWMENLGKDIRAELQEGISEIAALSN